ncbi:Zn-dependent oxidoreductase, NADPH:quinone reductase [Mycolicibacterium sp. P9-64]|uniref:zinc-dependent alcohol dehydrogenase family protein n=1 Tax=Mycolicibacterium sp. P9-64 TaxID=2024612 RepID=UPI0011EC0F7C|nr:zinc-dependent alcohol dehydrogenase family protein [Mycolicibacterium sp. P9-64]KAA0081975.1 Zn-dependent oxidoreductase, NADPH:quinone reductase [Mycolicibacterium sp. P9-64]
MKALRFAAFGDPADVLKCVDVPAPTAPGAGEVLVDVELSPLNFHDLFFIGGHLAPPTLPAVAGNEGVGTVSAIGESVTTVAVGDRIVLPLLTGAWREQVVVPADDLFALPPGPVEQLAMLGSNVPTAGLILSEYTDLTPGDWVIQNAANGGVGRSLIALARARGLRTVNLVRRPEVAEDLRALGADVVLTPHDGVVSEIADATDRQPIMLGVDSVGGASGAAVLGALASGAALVSYGNASGAGIDAAAAADKDVAVASIFVGAHDNRTKVVPVIQEAAPLVVAGALTVPVEAIYPLADVQAAIAHLHRGGKILLRVGGDG